MKKHYSIRVIALLALCSFVHVSPAQSDHSRDSLISSRISDLQAFWKKYNGLSGNAPKYESYAVLPSLYAVQSADTHSLAELKNKVSEAKLKLLKQDVGLDVNAGYLENFDPAITDDNIVYKRRLQAGVDWNILSDGLLSSRYKQRILKNERIINSLTPEKRSDGNDLITISHKIIYSFNIHKIKLLEQRQQIISDKIGIASELYLLKHLPRAELLAIMQQQVDVNSMNRVYKSYNDELKLRINEGSVPKDVLPLFDIDAAKMFAFTSQTSSDSILKLKIENIALQHKTLDDIKLNTQLRYNYYDMSATSGQNRNFMSAGIGLSVPIPLGIKTHKNVVEAEAKLMTYQHNENESAEQTDLLNYFYEFRYKLKQYSDFYEKRKKYEELIRVERVKEKFGDAEFNPLTALSLLDELLAIDIELLDIEQQMYLQLLDIHAKLPGSDVVSLVLPYQVDTISIVQEKPDRSIYIWSEAQEKYDASYIEEYLHLNKIGTAIISLKKDGSNKFAATMLFRQLSAAGIRSELLVGNNRLLAANDPAAFLDSLLSGIEISHLSAIHLDVEPHVLPGWDSNKEKSLDQYLALLKKIKDYSSMKKLSLSVSIPVFYPEAALKQIYSLADNVYLMAYEHKDADFILKKVQEEISIGKDKTVIALRAKDFKNRPECEALIQSLSEGLHVSRFAMHDLETFVKLDELSVQQEK